MILKLVLRENTHIFRIFLIYNSHIMQLTQLKCAIEWFFFWKITRFVRVPSKFNFKTSPPCQKRRCITTSILTFHPQLIPPSLTSMGAREPIIYFLSLLIYLFWIFHIESYSRCSFVTGLFLLA